MKTIRLLLCSFFICTLTALAAVAGDPTGNWTFTLTGPRGKSVDATLTLKFADGQLTGSINNRAGKAGITNGTFANEQVAFTVEREMRGREIVTNYSGKLDGDKITGTIETTGPKGKSTTVEWTAQRVK